MGREDAPTDVGSLCHPGTTQATLANRVDTGHTWLHWWHLGSPHNPLRQEESTTALFVLYFGQRTWAGLSSRRWVASWTSFGQQSLGWWLWDCAALPVESKSARAECVAGLIKMEEEQDTV